MAPYYARRDRPPGRPESSDLAPARNTRGHRRLLCGTNLIWWAAVVLSIAAGSTGRASEPEPGSDADACASGSLEGTFTVDVLGQALYRIPIAIPPGINGMQPGLAFEYNSMGPNSHLGVGWQLAGLSAITRTKASISQDGYVEGIHNDVPDRFMKDGLRLVADASNYGRPNCVYRTNPNIMDHIVSHGWLGDGAGRYGPAYFRVYTADGLIMEYGGNATSSQGRIEAPNAGDLVRAYGLSRVIDRNGNYMLFLYGENNGDGEFWIEEIQYTGRCNLQLTPNQLPGDCTGGSGTFNSIKFVYANLPPQSIENYYFAGGPARITKYLTGIEVWVDGVKVNEYRLKYDASFATARRLLREIKFYDGTGSEYMPATWFVYSDPSGGSMQSSPPTWWSNWHGGIRSVTSNRFFSGEWGVGFSGILAQGSFLPIPSIQGSMYRGPQGSRNAITIQAGVSYTFYFGKDKENRQRSLLGDFNGDGKTDFGRFLDDGSAHVDLSNGSGFVGAGTWLTGGFPVENNRLADFNRDGMTDVIFRWGQDGYVCLSNGQSFENSQVWLSGEPHEMEDWLIGDVNGDARSDIIVFPDNSHAPPPPGPATVYLSTGSGFTGAGSWGGNSFDGVGGQHLADFNGDGKADLIEFRPSQDDIRIWQSTGGNFVHVQTISATDPGQSIPGSYFDNEANLLPGDFNGDGYVDFCVFQPIWNASHQTVTSTPVYFWLSSGRPSSAAFVRATTYDGANTGAIYATPAGLGNYDLQFGARTADFNGDSKADIIVFFHYQNPNSAYVWYSMGSSFQSSLYFPGGFGLLREDAIGDFDGDGRADVLQFAATGQQDVYVWLTAQRPFPDKLSLITDGDKHRTFVSYCTLSKDNGVYRGHTALTGMPDEARHIRGPIRVVETVETSNGHDGAYITNFGYSGAKLDVSHGFLGFEEIHNGDPQKNLYGVASYNQDFPRTGTKKTSQLYHVQGGTNEDLVLEETTWDVVPNGVLNFAAVHQSFVRQRTYGDGGALRSHVEATYVHDIHENVISEDVTYSSGVTQRLIATYADNEFQWLLGLNTRNTIVASAPSLPSKTITVDAVYDPLRGLPLQTVRRWASGSGPFTLTGNYNYSPAGNLLDETISGSGFSARTRRITYDSAGRFPVAFENPLGHRFSVAMNPRFGRPDEIVDPNGLRSRWTYDAFGRMKKETRPDGTEVKINYCITPPAGEAPNYYMRSLRVRETGKPTHRSYYDELGRERRRCVDAMSGVTRPITVDTDYGLDLELASTTEPYHLGLVSPVNTFTHDDLGRLTSQIQADNLTYSYSYSTPASVLPNPIVTANGLGHTVSRRRSDNRVTAHSYDDLGRLIQVQELDGFGGPVLSVVSFAYDAAGIPHKMADGNGNVATVETDDAGYRLGLQDPDLGNVSFSIDALGQVISSTDGAGRTRTYQYDLLGRVTRRTDPEGTSQWVYDSDAIGELSSVTGPNGYVGTYTHDALGRLSAMATSFNGELQTMSFAYDGLGRLQDVTYPGTPPLTVRYYCDGRGYFRTAKDLSTGASFVWLDAMTSRFQPVQMTLGNGVKQTMSYNPTNGNMTALAAGVAPPYYNDIQSVRFTYDPLRRMIEKRDSRDFNRIESFDYDQLDRILEYRWSSDIVSGLPVSYRYDAAGNILSKSDVGTYTYDPLDKPHAVRRIEQFGDTRDLTYDQNGNLLSDGERTYAWSSLDLPVGVSDGAGGISFEYDPDGRKIYQRETPGINDTYYLPGLYERRVPGDGEPAIHRFVHALGRPIAEVIDRPGGSRVIRYLGYDNLGSLEVTMEGTAVTSRTFFPPFGRRWFAAGTTTTIGYTGHEQLDGVDLVDMKMRKYEARFGRFVSADPVIPDAMNTQGMNRYCYAYNSPTLYVDPEGYQPCPTFGTRTTSGSFGFAASPIWSITPFPTKSVDPWEPYRLIKNVPGTGVKFKTYTVVRQQMPAGWGVPSKYSMVAKRDATGVFLSSPIGMSWQVPVAFESESARFWFDYLKRKAAMDRAEAEAAAEAAHQRRDELMVLGAELVLFVVLPESKLVGAVRYAYTGVEWVAASCRIYRGTAVAADVSKAVWSGYELSKGIEATTTTLGQRGFSYIADEIKEDLTTWVLTNMQGGEDAPADTYSFENLLQYQKLQPDATAVKKPLVIGVQAK